MSVSLVSTSSLIASAVNQVMTAPAPPPVLKTSPPHPKTVLNTDFRPPVAEQIKNTGHVDVMA